MRQMQRLVSAIIITIILITSVICFSGCAGIGFEDDTFAHVFSEAFDKKVNAITEEDLAQIQGIEIVTYSSANYVVITLEGYYEEKQNGADKEALQKYVKRVDITDMEILSFDDLGRLVNLKEFDALYVPISDFDFLKECQNLEIFTISNNNACDDYTFLSGFGNLKELYITSCAIKDPSFISNLKGLKSLSLDYCTSGEYMLYDISCVSTLEELEELSISSIMVYDISPLSNLKKLKFLNASYNGIDDVTPLSQLSELVYIDLTQNPISDLSSLVNFDPEKFERIILDLNTLITDWSPLDYLGSKVQGKPTPSELAQSAQ